MADHQKKNVLEVPPRADALIETFRAIGYSIQTAVADLIDNSITAKAKNIWIDFHWNAEGSCVKIIDDGIGMDEVEIVEAMRPGSQKPSVQRDKDDLGRFGLGLKTASFSQCKSLTVYSLKKEHELTHWTWDLSHIDKVNKWELIQAPEKPEISDLLYKQMHGTCVVWEHLDRLTKGTLQDNEKDRAGFYRSAKKVKTHIAMVFHRYLEKGKINIFFNERKVTPWDPFLKGVTGSQIINSDTIHKGIVKIQGYVLPHKSKLTEDEYLNAEGPQGWNAQQGFYIYRNERLLVAGGWLGMFKQEEHYKLARIMVDLPNTLDNIWQLDIKKSVAIPPPILKRQLKSIAAKIRERAVEVFKYKGKVLRRQYASDQFYPVWQEKIYRDKRYYQINREHPVIQEVMSKAGNVRKEIKALLTLIQETVPVDLIMIRQSENPEAQGEPFGGENHGEVKKLIRRMYESLLQKGKTSEEAKGIIFNIEPFNAYPQYIEILNP